MCNVHARSRRLSKSNQERDNSFNHTFLGTCSHVVGFQMGVMFKSAAEQRLFLSVLMRLVDYSGFIRIDGIEIQNISFQKLREKIFIISHVSILIILYKKVLEMRSSVNDRETKLTSCELECLKKERSCRVNKDENISQKC